MSTEDAEPFSAFMQRALYDPQRGYYTSHIRTVGARGDFSTSATHSLLLAQAIARWLRQTDGPRTLIEIGAGNGQLMTGILDELGWWRRRAWQVFIVETSPVLQNQQRERLGKRVKQWFGRIEDALAACDGEAMIVHNEVLDAFPVDIIEHREGCWHEVWSHRGREMLRPVRLDPAHYSALRTQAREGQRCELHTAVRAWLAGWVPRWMRGTMLSIDYGDEFPALYHRRPHGTLRAYLMQQRLEGADVYANPGRQDITCDVNFTDVRAWLEEFGASELSFETQREFIHRMLGPTPASFVTDDDGAGTAFRCLVHSR